MREASEPRRAPRGRGDDGAAVVELAFVMVLLFTLVFAIISFGLILSFKQDMTRAAAEGARAGAVALPLAGQTPEEAALAAAQGATEEAVKGFGGSFSTPGCTRAGMDCSNVAVGPCSEDPTRDCVTVELVFDYGAEPLYGRLPLVSAFLPDEVRAGSVARIND